MLGVVVLLVVGVALSRLGSGRGLTVRVSVDDLAIGRLPSVCVKSGRTSDVLVPVESSESAFQPWWLLLLLLGPLGVMAMVVLWATSDRPSRVGGHVPVSAAVLQGCDAATRASRRFLTAGLVAMVAGIGVLAAPGMAVVPPDALRVAVAGAVVGGLVASAVAASVARRRWVDLRLDGSGRWVMIGDVHPSFAAAVREQYATENLSERG